MARKLSSMQCPNCNSFFTRIPCPECGWDKKEKIVEHPEKMVKPSELFRQSEKDETKSEEIEHLRKPSEMINDEPEVEESLRKPSEMVKAAEDEKEDSVEHLRKPSEMFPQSAAEEKEDSVEHLKKPSEMFKAAEDEKEDSVEHLRKPSEMFPQSTAMTTHETTDSLVKPSELKGTIVQRQSRPRDIQETAVESPIQKPGEQLLRPSELGGTSGRAISKESTTSIKSVNRDLKNMKSNGKSDQKFRKNVKATLNEVINLLGDLIEEED